MSVLVSDIVVYGSASMPSDSVSTTGGAFAPATRLAMNDIAATGYVNYVSSSASDTACTITITGRDAAGVVQTEAKVVNGQVTPISGAQLFQRILQGVASGTSAVGDLAVISNTAISSGKVAPTFVQATASSPATMTLYTGDGALCSLGNVIRILSGTGQYQLRYIVGISGDTVQLNRSWDTLPASGTSTYGIYNGIVFDLLPQKVTTVRRPFYQASADVAGGSNRTFYEKVFLSNNNTSTTLTGTTITLQAVAAATGSNTWASTSATLELASCKVLNDTQTTANRLTLPTNLDASALTFTTGSIPLATPQTMAANSANLPYGGAAASAEGVWLALYLPAGAGSFNGSFTLRTQGQST